MTGNLNVDYAMCVLSLNIINDKIFLIEWYDCNLDNNFSLSHLYVMLAQLTIFTPGSGSSSWLPSPPWPSSPPWPQLSAQGFGGPPSGKNEEEF